MTAPYSVLISVVPNRLDYLLEQLVGKPHTKREATLDELHCFFEGIHIRFAFEYLVTFAVDFEKQTDAVLLIMFMEVEEAKSKSWVVERNKAWMEAATAFQQEAIREAKKNEKWLSSLIKSILVYMVLYTTLFVGLNLGLPMVMKWLHLK